MKKFIKIIVFVLTMVMATSSVACSGGDGGLDKGKSHLYVGTVAGGFRSNWIDTWAEEFEDLYAEYSFEEGKKGVDIHPVEKANIYQLDVAAQNVRDGDYTAGEIIFTEQCNYFEFMNSDAVLDITEWITTPLTEYNESRSIVDKMSAYDKDYYNVSTEVNGSEYYAVPWYTAFEGFNYDVDLFESGGYYIAAQGKGDKYGCVIDELTERGKGPDGKTGIINNVDYSIDDGLPATYDEFFNMCDKMVEDGVVPVIWAGHVQGVINNLADALEAQCEGAEDMALNYTFNGTAHNLIKNVNEATIELESKEIDSSNGYELRRQAGKYYALEFLNRLLTTTNAQGEPKYYDYDDGYTDSFDHHSAQSKFLLSRVNSAAQPIAMIIDGTWWCNEAIDTFNEMKVGGPEYSQKERNVGVLTLPKPNYSFVESSEGNTMMQSWTTSVVVKKSIDPSKLELARAFYRFVHTDKALSSFMVDANAIRPFAFDLTGYNENDLSKYTLSQYKLYQNNEIVMPYSNGAIAKNYLSNITCNWNSVSGNKTYSRITEGFNYKNPISAKTYFEGLQLALTKQAWENKFVV